MQLDCAMIVGHTNSKRKNTTLKHTRLRFVLALSRIRVKVSLFSSCPWLDE